MIPKIQYRLKSARIMKGMTLREAGYWTCCSEHSQLHREGGKQPEMKLSAIRREKSRDKKTGYLPANYD